MYNTPCFAHIIIYYVLNFLLLLGLHLPYSFVLLYLNSQSLVVFWAALWCFWKTFYS